MVRDAPATMAGATALSHVERTLRTPPADSDGSPRRALRGPPTQPLTRRSAAARGAPEASEWAHFGATRITGTSLVRRPYFVRQQSAPITKRVQTKHSRPCLYYIFFLARQMLIGTGKSLHPFTTRLRSS